MHAPGFMWRHSCVLNPLQLVEAGHIGRGSDAYLLCGCQVEEELEKERGALGLDEQVQLLLHSLQHDSASVQATAVQARPAAWLPMHA